MLQERIAELIARHGSLRAAARVLECDPGYLSRLQSGEKDNPEDWLLRRMKLRRVVTYERTDSPALQHQEVPREPVARPSMSMYASAADYSAAMDGWIAATRQCPACRGKFGVDGQACDLCNATGRVPSTTRQQEVGSGWITISKRLPEAGQTVLAYWPREDGKADVAGWQFATAQFWPGDPAMWHNPEDDEDDYVAPSHWQPLASAPSTPEKGEKDGTPGVMASGPQRYLLIDGKMQEDEHGNWQVAPGVGVGHHESKAPRDADGGKA